MLLALVTLAAGSIRPAIAATPDLSYATNVSWHVDRVPELGLMEGTIEAVLKRDHASYPNADAQTVDGFFPGPTYSYEKLPGWTPFYFFMRDTATALPMIRYLYPKSAMRSTINEFLRLQYPDGAISAIVGPDNKTDKATVVSDEETSLIVGAVLAYAAQPEPAWLTSNLRGMSVIERLNASMQWVMTQRLDASTRLIKRAHTTDWGDVKWEPGTGLSKMQPGDQWTASIYDQAIAYAAVTGLARLNAIVGRDADRARWEAEAADLRTATDMALWMDDPKRGYYRVHLHLPPYTLEHEFNEDDVVAIGNAAAVYYGLATPDKVPRIWAALEQSRLNAGAFKPGMTLDPPYEGWPQVQMDQRMYQNGAIWDWWGGRQVTAEFSSGYTQLARDHLFMIARDWATHPGTVREWESPWKDRFGQDQAYAGAAAVVGQAVIEGLFGISLAGREVRLTPRLDDLSGGIRVYEPATDTYVAYEYTATDNSEAVQYGTNSPTAIAVRLPVRWAGDTLARLDDKDVLPVTYERVGETLLGTVIVPSGSHRVAFSQVPLSPPKF